MSNPATPPSASAVSAEDAAAQMRFAGAPVDAERAPDLAKRLGYYREALQQLDRYYTVSTEPIGLRVPDEEPGEEPQ